MKQITVGNIRMKVGSLALIIPGGWKATVPRVTPDPTTLAALVRYFLPDFGGDESKATAKALSTIQRCFEAGYLTGVNKTLKRRAQEYAEAFPELLRPHPRWRSYNVLLGFDPERVQSLYVPFENTGKRGKPFARALLTEMAQEALATQAQTTLP